ncbi:MAG TPA: helix-turn-helix domain-containing protein [Gammaproteobacteria bacterium]|nr:helix-turn-helix domain-containing protein [Gammaproteobacteria bacterium]
MNIKLIHTEAEYRNALHAVEELWDAAEDTPESDRLEVLVLLIQDYEARHYPVPDPDPIHFLEHVMEARELSRKDLEPYIGSRARVTEILNRRRALTLDMIRKLSAGLKLPTDVLVRSYPLKRSTA